MNAWALLQRFRSQACEGAHVSETRAERKHPSSDDNRTASRNAWLEERRTRPQLPDLTLAGKTLSYLLTAITIQKQYYTIEMEETPPEATESDQDAAARQPGQAM